MAIPIKRVLTMKSKLGFGKYGEYPLGVLMELNKQDVILEAYYKTTNIDFNFETRIALKMSSKHLIEKPGKNIDMYMKVLEELYPGMYNRRYRSRLSDRAKAMRGRNKERISGDKLRRKNQGK